MFFVVWKYTTTDLLSILWVTLLPMVDFLSLETKGIGVIVEVNMDSKGEFLGGKLIPTKLIDRGVPALDPEKKALTLSENSPVMILTKLVFSLHKMEHYKNLDSSFFVLMNTTVGAYF